MADTQKMFLLGSSPVGDAKDVTGHFIDEYGCDCGVIVESERIETWDEGIVSYTVWVKQPEKEDGPGDA